MRSRRRFTLDQKRYIVNEMLEKGLSMTEVSMKYDIHYNQLYKWRRDYRAALKSQVQKPNSQFLVTALPPGYKLTTKSNLQAKIEELARQSPGTEILVLQAVKRCKATITVEVSDI